MSKALSVVATLAALLASALVAPASHADPSFPYGDHTTANIADKLQGTDRGGWLATMLDYGCRRIYTGPRKAEIVMTSRGHGRRAIGIIHVTKTKRAKKVRRTLECQGVWFVQRGTRFVVPLRSSTWTNGGAGKSYKKSAKWAKGRLGSRWTVR